MTKDEFLEIVEESIVAFDEEGFPHDVTVNEMRDVFVFYLNQKLDREKIANALRRECSSYCLDNEEELQKVAEILSKYRL